MAVKRKVFEANKIYTYNGTEGAYSVVLGEILEGAGYPTLSYGDSAPVAGSGKNGDVHIDKTNFKLYTRGPTSWDSGVNFKGIKGDKGDAGAPGNALTAYLTNETHTVASAGIPPYRLIGSTPLMTAGGNLKVLNGTSEVTSDIVYQMNDETASNDTHSWKIKGGADSGTGLKVRINKTTGAYDVSQTGLNTWTSESETFNITATTDGTTLTKTYKITKSKGATIVSIKSSGQSLRVTSTGTPVNVNDKITFQARRQGASGTGTGDITWKVYGIRTDSLEEDITSGTTVGNTGTVLTVASTGNEDKVKASMTTPQLLVGLKLPEGSDYVALKVEASFDGTEDEITVNAVANGADGADGVPAITGYLTNEIHSVPAFARGDNRISKEALSVTTIIDAGGTFKVVEGGTDRTSSATFSLPTGQGENSTGTIANGVSMTKNGLTMELITSGASKGQYALKTTNITTWTSARGETFNLQAVYGGVTVTKTYTIVKSKTGASITLTPSAYSFSLNGSGAVKNTSDVITFTTKLGSAKGSKNATNDDVAWKVYGVAADGVTATELQSSTTAQTGTYLQVLSSTDLTEAKMTGTMFQSILGTYSAARVRAIYDDVIDQVTITGASDGADGAAGADGADAISGYLTNESDIVGADADGVVSSLAAATGNFIVQKGSTTVSSNIVYYASTSGTNTTQTLNGLRLTINSSTGAYSLAETSSGSWNTTRETFTVRAIYSGVSPSVTVTKTYKISKAVRGLVGLTGATGPQGIQGLIGNTGAQGIQGIKGDGISTYSATLSDDNIVGSSNSTANRDAEYLILNSVIQDVGSIVTASNILNSTTNAVIGRKFVINTSGNYTVKFVNVIKITGSNSTSVNVVSAIRVAGSSNTLNEADIGSGGTLSPFGGALGLSSISIVSTKSNTISHTGGGTTYAIQTHEKTMKIKSGTQIVFTVDRGASDLACTVYTNTLTGDETGENTVISITKI